MKTDWTPFLNTFTESLWKKISVTQPDPERPPREHIKTVLQIVGYLFKNFFLLTNSIHVSFIGFSSAT